MTCIHVANVISPSNPCAVTLCKAGTTCEVIDGKAVCVGPGDSVLDLPADLLDGDNICARVDLVCPIPGSTCQAVNGKATCVPPPVTPENPCDTASCGPATVCVAFGRNAKCVPNIIG